MNSRVTACLARVKKRHKSKFVLRLLSMIVDNKRYHFPMQMCTNERRIEQVKETVFLGVSSS